jgi:hypothetical protein
MSNTRWARALLTAAVLIALGSVGRNFGGHGGGEGVVSAAPAPTATECPPQPSPTATPEPTPTPQPTATPVPGATATPEPTPTPEPTATPGPPPGPSDSSGGPTGDTGGSPGTPPGPRRPPPDLCMAREARHRCCEKCTYSSGSIGCQDNEGRGPTRCSDSVSVNSGGSQVPAGCQNDCPNGYQPCW